MKVKKTVKRVMFIKNMAIPMAKRIRGAVGLAMGIYSFYTMAAKIKNR